MSVPMLDVTPQERLALIVIAVLITGGALARHTVFNAHAGQTLEFTANSADSLIAAGANGLLQRVGEEVARQELRDTPLEPGERLDPNAAPAEQLDRLPRVGPAIADRIVAFRAAGGRFRSAEDLRQVSGIGPSLLAAIEPHLDFSRAPPAAPRSAAVGARDPGGSRTPPPGSSPSSGGRVQINRATAEELQSLPGIGPVIAERIVTYREENGPFRTFEDLENVSGVGPRLRERLQAEARLGT